MKRWLCVILSLMLVTLVGCARPAPADTDPPAPEGGEAAPASTPASASEPAATALPPAIPRPGQRQGHSATSGKPFEGDYRPVAVMVENTKAAYPQSGLSRADIVYEMTEEGGVTRFMAIYGDAMPDKCGPIRSTRPYYVDVVMEYDAILTHFGGPPGTIQQKFKDVGIKQREDGETGSKLIYRDSAREAPHNCYVDLAKVQEKYTYTPEVRTFAFDYDGVHSYPGDKETQVDLQYTSFNKISYRWDEDKGHYRRFLNGAVMEDALNGETLYADNIIIQYAPHNSIAGDDAGRINISLIGQGRFEAVVDGIKVEGTWMKKDIPSPTEFIVQGEDHLLLSPGITYIQVVIPTQEVIYTQ